MANPFNVGDFITCVDDQGAVGLTVGQWYKVDEIIDDKTIKVLADNLKPGTFWVGRFVTGYYYQGGLISSSNPIDAALTLPAGISVDSYCDIDTHLVYSPGRARAISCDMGCKFVGEGHAVNCAAYNPDQKVKF